MVQKWSCLHKNKCVLEVVFSGASLAVVYTTQYVREIFCDTKIQIMIAFIILNFVVQNGALSYINQNLKSSSFIIIMFSIREISVVHGHPRSKREYHDIKQMQILDTLRTSKSCRENEWCWDRAWGMVDEDRQKNISARILKQAGLYEFQSSQIVSERNDRNIWETTTQCSTFGGQINELDVLQGYRG